MLTRQLCGSGMGFNEQLGEYCSSVLCGDSDRLNRDINYLLYFTLIYSYGMSLAIRMNTHYTVLLVTRHK